MPLSAIRAHFICDGCGSPMSFDIDEAYTPPTHWSLFDVAVDAVRGGSSREGFMTSVQGESDQCLCGKCTRTVDNSVEEDRNATDDEIRAALDRELYPKTGAK